MHLSEKTRPTDFIIHDQISTDRLEKPVKQRQLSSLIPNFSTQTRLAVITHQPLDALGASNFITACVAEFYERYRQRESHFFVYPDYFTFQLTARPDDPLADYGYFDIWPMSKNIGLEAGADRIFQIINELRIDVLLLPFVDTEASSVLPHHLMANLPVRHYFFYAADGVLPQANLSIQRPLALLDNSVETVVNSVADQVYAGQTLERWQHQTHRNGWITEVYRQVSTELGSQYLTFLLGSR